MTLVKSFHTTIQCKISVNLKTQVQARHCKQKNTWEFYIEPHLDILRDNSRIFQNSRQERVVFRAVVLGIGIVIQQQLTGYDVTNLLRPVTTRWSYAGFLSDAYTNTQT